MVALRKSEKRDRCYTKSRFFFPVPPNPPSFSSFRSSSARATGTHTIPLSVVKLGFVLNGHEFDGDSDGNQQASRESLEEQEAYRYDQLKATLATLIVQVCRDRPRFRRLFASMYARLLAGRRVCLYMGELVR